MTNISFIRCRFALAALLLAGLAWAAPFQAVHAPATPPKASQAAKATPQAAGAHPAPSPVAPVANEYVLGPGDVVAIDVYQEPEVSRTLPVRPDGRLSLPLAGEIMAQGLTPDQLQAAITEHLKKYIDHPAVTVMLQDAESHRFTILGNVTRPSSYPIAHPMTILDAIAAAGGLTEFAHANKIYLIRKRASDGVEMRYNFNYKLVSLGVAPKQNVELQDNDVIVVP